MDALEVRPCVRLESGTSGVTAPRLEKEPQSRLPRNRFAQTILRASVPKSSEYDLGLHLQPLRSVLRETISREVMCHPEHVTCFIFVKRRGESECVTWKLGYTLDGRRQSYNCAPNARKYTRRIHEGFQAQTSGVQ